MSGKILNTFKRKITGLNLVPQGGGCFEFSINGELVYSKLQSGVFPDEMDMLNEVSSRLKSKAVP